MAIAIEILGGDVQLSGNPIEIKCTGGSAPAGSTNYKIMLRIIDVDDKLLAVPEPDAIAPDASGESLFDIAGIVDQPVEAVFQYPLVGASYAYETRAFKIQVQCGEMWTDTNGDLQETWGATSAEFEVLKGGASQRQLQMWTAAGTNFYETYLENGRFLSHRPWGDFVHPTQPVKLWFMTPTAVAASYSVKAWYDDSTTDTYSVNINLSVGFLYEFNCNPEDLGISMETGSKKCTHFDCWLEKQSDASAVSDTRRFSVDWRPCQWPLFLMFTNSIGGVDDVYLSGTMVEGLSVNGEIVYKQPERDSTVFQASLISPGKTGKNTWKINTGYKSRAQMLHLRDLLIARNVWLLYPNSSLSNYNVIPVNIMNTDPRLVDRSKELYSLTLELQEAHDSKFSFDNRLY